MEPHLSTSNMRIANFPLLPPLITSNIIQEIQYYKNLAIAVDERLKILEIAKDSAGKNRDKKIKDIFDFCSNGPSIGDFSVINPEIGNFNKPLNGITNNIIDHPTKDKCETLIDIETSANEKEFATVNTSNSDENKSSTDTLLGSSLCSDTITASTDLNQYLHSSASLITETTETPSESLKPNVPKTLNIVPILLDKSKPPDKCSTDKSNTSLVRQGSYVLDAPSPMLLAHYQNDEKKFNKDYRPTIGSKRKEWSINQSVTDWEPQSNKKELSSFIKPVNTFKKGTNIPSQRVCKSVSNSKTGSPLDIYQPAKSVDCIQAMFEKESCFNKSKNKMTNSQKYSSTISGSNGIKNSKKLSQATPILNLANKFSGSLKSLSSNSQISLKRSNKKSIGKSSDFDTANDNNFNNQSSDNSKTAITSEKLVSVFKEIQDSHKKQMVELMTRQQKEQLSMQENFKRQQILLLAQIRKAFPEISVLSLSEIITGKTPSKSDKECISFLKKQTEDTNGTENAEPKNQDNTNIELLNSDSYSSKNNASPVNKYSNELINLQNPICPNSAGNHQSSCQPTQTLTKHMFVSGTNALDEMPVGNPLHRHSSVSRQLFPFDSKSSRISILDTTNYTDKHINAVTKINAYARGFLVRRLMKTDKVIALKNTYKEALHCMLRLHVDAPLNLPELNLHQRLQLQCDSASVNIVELFSLDSRERMEIISQDREIKKARSERPSSARSSYSFATQRTLARKKMKEMGINPSLQNSMMTRSCPARTRCQTWSSNAKEKKLTSSMINHSIKRSTSTGAVRKPWR